ncbi:MAG TPA: GDSL-type esterase/lipase family protein [Capsulimonadaceae bacterium]|jgi:lysophospholipase L1-like esterase
MTSPRLSFRFVRLVYCLVVIAVAAYTSHADPVWRTAFVKRGFVGTYQSGWAGGVGATIRNRMPLAFSGTKVRVTLRSDYGADVQLAKLTLVPGGSGPGSIEGSPLSVTITGKQDAALPMRSKEVLSDEIDATIKAGTWYLQETFASTTYSYAYNVDAPSFEAGDQHAKPLLSGKQSGAWLGNAYRVDVLTTDTRPLILCYGDSITAGYNSTANAGCSYPEQLSKLLNRPVLNMGVNGDVITQRAYCASEIRALNGVNVVLFLMGVNDILTGGIKSLDKYQQCTGIVVKQLHESGIKVYWGTIPPFNGYKAGFTAGTTTLDLDKEALRKQINDWIRTSSGADGVIDYDKALCDSGDPSKLRADFQSDWLHPNDAGYHRMADVAAAVLR